VSALAFDSSEKSQSPQIQCGKLQLRQSPDWWGEGFLKASVMSAIATDVNVAWSVCLLHSFDSDTRVTTSNVALNLTPGPRRKDRFQSKFKLQIASKQ